MKILFFSPYFHPYTSGITTYPYKIFTYLARKHEITVLTFKHDPTLPDSEEINGFKVIRMPYLFMVSKGFISPQSLSFFWKHAKSADKVIINIPNFEGFPLAIMAKLMNKKIFSLFHCNVVFETGLIAKFIGLVLNASMALQLALTDTIIGYTEDYVSHSWVGKTFKKKFKLTLPPIEPFIADAAKLAEFKQEKGQDIWIGYAGRISQEKGIEYLVGAVHLLEFKHTVKLVFAGPYGADVAGEHAYYDKIVSLLQKHNIPYTFLGTLHARELTAFYKAVDVLVLPSVNSTEAFGMVQAEAMLAGTPVITTDLPGVRMPVKLTGMGQIVPKRDIQSLTAAITDVLDNKSKYVNEKTKTAATEIFDIDKTYQFYDTLLKP
ncbi:MAG: glycosyltransferase family 4 protein [Weeksellaceae bacterium]